MTISTEFAESTDQYRRELLVYCYRMLGSLHDAEDLVQETLRAWRSREKYDEGRASLRTWLYRIATNACLTALEQIGRRALPAEMFDPSTDSGNLPEPGRHDLPWLQPIPDALLDPAVIAESRSSVRLAFIVALQDLSAKQRAALILRDVLDWPAVDVAGLLDTSTAAVNSALQRARAHMATLEPQPASVSEPDDAQQREVLNRYLTAFVDADMTTLAGLLRDDVVFEMPPSPTWFAGRDDVVAFLGARTRVRPNRFRGLLTRANGRPAVASYLIDTRCPVDTAAPSDAWVYRAHSIQLFTVTTTGIARMTAFVDSSMFTSFDLPPSLTG